MHSYQALSPSTFIATSDFLGIVNFLIWRLSAFSCILSLFQILNQQFSSKSIEFAFLQIQT